MKKGIYKVELIDVADKDDLYQENEDKYLFTRKASIYDAHPPHLRRHNGESEKL